MEFFILSCNLLFLQWNIHVKTYPYGSQAGKMMNMLRFRLLVFLPLFSIYIISFIQLYYSKFTEMRSKTHFPLSLKTHFHDERDSTKKKKSFFFVWVRHSLLIMCNLQRIYFNTVCALSLNLHSPNKIFSYSFYMHILHSSLFAFLYISSLRFVVGV